MPNIDRYLVWVKGLETCKDVSMKDIILDFQLSFVMLHANAYYCNSDVKEDDDPQLFLQLKSARDFLSQESFFYAQEMDSKFLAAVVGMGLPH